MKKVILYLIMVNLFTLISCSGGDENKESIFTDGLELRPNTTSIIADNSNEVVFQVFYNGKDVTSGAVVHCRTTGISLVYDNGVFRFKTNQIGDYVFYANYGEYRSGTVTITAKDKEQEQHTLIITPDKNSIAPDGIDAVTFTVMFDDTDVTSSAMIRNISTGDAISGAKFTTTQMGEHRFQATYNQYTSNTITISTSSIFPEERAKRIKSITRTNSDNTRDVTDFEYDSQDRVLSAIHRKGDDRDYVIHSFYFTYSENTIQLDWKEGELGHTEIICYLDQNGYIGNMTNKYIDGSGNEGNTYNYDFYYQNNQITSILCTEKTLDYNFSWSNNNIVEDKFYYGSSGSTNSQYTFSSYENKTAVNLNDFCGQGLEHRVNIIKIPGMYSKNMVSAARSVNGTNVYDYTYDYIADSDGYIQRVFMRGSSSQTMDIEYY